MNPVWSATIKDDVSSVLAKMASNIEKLDSKASTLFKASGGNFKAFSDGLKKSGASVAEASIIVGKYRRELSAAAKGLSETTTQVSKATPEMLKFANAWTQIGTAMAKAQIRASAMPSTWSRMKDAFKGAVSPRQIAIGAARGVGDRIAGGVLGAPGAAFGMVESIAEKAIGVGKSFAEAVIDAAQFRQNALSGLEYMLGSRQEAVKIFADAQRLAQDTPLDTDQVITGIKQLVTAGFSGKDSMVLFKAVADQASKYAGVEGMQDNVIAAFSRVRGRGVATGEDLDSFRKAGFQVEGIVQSLLENPNLAPLFRKIKIPGLAGGKTKYVDQKDADKEAIQKQVTEILGQGRIGTFTFLNAALKSLERNKPDIGEYAKQMGASSLTGTISNFKSAFRDLLKSTDIQKWQGIEALQGFLTRINEALKPTSESGKRLLEVFRNLTDSMLGGLKRIQSGDIESFLKKVGMLADAISVALRTAWDWFDKLIIQGKPDAFAAAVKDALVEVGSFIGQGILKGFKAAVTGAVESTENKAMGTKYGASGLLSDRFVPGTTPIVAPMWSGNTPESFDVGTARLPGGVTIPKMGAGGLVTRPTLALIGEAGPEAVVPLDRGSTAMRAGSGGLGGVSLLINVNGMAGGSPAEIGNAVALCVRREITSLMSRSMMEG